MSNQYGIPLKLLECENVVLSPGRLEVWLEQDRGTFVDTQMAVGSTLLKLLECDNVVLSPRRLEVWLEQDRGDK